MFSYILIISILLLDLALGIIIYLKDRKDIINRNFFLVSFWVAVWITVNFLENESFFRNLGPLFLKVDFASGILLAYYFFFFCINFPRKLKLSFFQKISLIFPALSLFILSFTSFIIKDIDFYDSTIKFERGTLYWIYALVIASYIAVGSLSLVFKLLRRLKGLERVQTLYILIGFTLSAILAASVNLILTQIIEISTEINRIGIYGIAFFIIFTAYAIIKHHLMDIRVVATELLVGLVSLVLFVDLFLSRSISDAFLKLTIFIVFIYLGISLIRSVLKEIKQRQQLETMTIRIRKAYEVEKKANRELKRLDEVKGQFMMATQHHLRTPLTSMNGYMDLIFGGTYGKVPPKLKETLKKFQVSTMRLIKIVNELLDLSQFQLGKKVVSLKPNMDIAPILKEVVEELKLAAETKGIYVRLKKAEGAVPLVSVDPEKLKAALSNLIDNGIKYTNQGGVTVSYSASNGKLRIMIKDTGIGMLKEELKDVFHTTFERGKEAKKVFTTGRGIGLYISYQIIKAHKGKVWVESEGKRKGSAFFVELPAG